MTVLSAWAFYKNDQPNGFGIGFDDAKIVPIVMEHLESGLKLYDEHAKPDDPELFFRQLDYIARESKVKKLSNADAVVAMQLVHWLEQRGHLRPDEYNGMHILQQI